METSYNKKVQIDNDELKNHCSSYLTGSLLVFIKKKKKKAKVPLKMANNHYKNLWSMLKQIRTLQMGLKNLNIPYIILWT